MVLPGHSMRGKTVRIAAPPGASKRLILTALLAWPQLGLGRTSRRAECFARSRSGLRCAVFETICANIPYHLAGGKTPPPPPPPPTPSPPVSFRAHQHP